MKKVIAIRHVAFEDLGSFALVLKERGYEIQYIDVGAENLQSINLNTSDLVVMLGGPIGVYDESNYPCLRDEFRLLEHRLSSDLPTLGICLGGQMIAKVLGANVYPGASGKEIGWSPITLSEAGECSALKPLSLSDAVLHWHGDTFDIPPECVHLASSAQYENQAFSYKKNVLALQFHPEVTSQSLERWFLGHACEINSTEGISVLDLRKDTQQYATALQIHASLFWQNWLDQIESIYRSSDFREVSKV